MIAIYYIAATIFVVVVVIWATAVRSAKSTAALTMKEWLYPPICRAPTRFTDGSHLENGIETVSRQWCSPTMTIEEEFIKSREK
ncbi:Hypothetical predicted protein [Olea europaea subsp. europaea]|uniref:Uncharacterized protein n=1 Tax=Olea europaea subsp. europaea TaxID=158383 RepID=A0A8S0R2K4_OLEEU|nr:Hypothetical predicted protein [Olea europaea subsp. europaea]